MEIAPTLGNRDLEVAPTLGNRDLEVAPTLGNRDLEIAPTLGNRDLEIAPTEEKAGATSSLARRLFRWNRNRFTSESIGQITFLECFSNSFLGNLLHVTVSRGIGNLAIGFDCLLKAFGGEMRFGVQKRQYCI